MKRILLLVVILFIGCTGTTEVTKIVSDSEPVIEYTTRFTITVTQGATTEATLDYPVLTLAGTEYNVETMAPDVAGAPVTVTYQDEIRRVAVNMSFDSYAENAAIGYNLLDMSIIEFSELLTVIYAPPYVPDYSTAFFSLTGSSAQEQEVFDIGTELVLIGTQTYPYSFFPYSVDPLIVHITIEVNQDNSWFWYNDNLITYFGIDYSCMTLPEIQQLADMMEIHDPFNPDPELRVTWVDLQEMYPME